MAYGEVTVATEPLGGIGGLPGHYRWGVYYDPRTFPDYPAAGTNTGTIGPWLSCDQAVYREEPDERQGLGVFFRYGWREEESYATSSSHSLGFEYTGPLPRRDRDAFGVGYFDLGASDDYRDAVAPAFRGESGYESYYRIHVSPWLVVTPGVQYVTDPGGLSSSRDAVAFVLRTRMEL